MAAFAATASKRGALADMDKAAIDVAKALARLSEVTIFELRGEWRRLHRMPPPMRLSRDLLTRGITYKLQERAYGGLSKAAARKLEQAAAGPPSRGATKPTPPIALRPGTRLVREWRGVTHTALIHADGIEWRGQRYSSLSVVARKITGARWSGPRFFGLRRQLDSHSKAGGAMAKADLARTGSTIRCAIYTRKSSDEGLEQEFNSLDAQREACEAYIVSQRHAGWVALADMYEDGGLSGGTMERPTLKRLLEDITAGKVQIVVVYKVNRLTRSLADFAKIVDVLDAHNASFVSVTQQFNTTTSMGRLTLNMLLSFSQFEREIAGERIRDKIAASKKKGMWMGGNVPLGYDVKDRKLVIDEEEAATVRMIFERFLKVGSATLVARALNAEGVTTRRGKPIDKGFLYKLLNNRVYIGDAVHKGTAYPGEHAAIVDRDLWNRVHGILQESPRVRARHTRTTEPALLTGLIFGPAGGAMSPTYTRKAGGLYRYYVSQSVLKLGLGTCPIRTAAAAL